MANSGPKISELVKEMVKEMDANDFYARGDIYDESLEEPWFNIEVQLAQGEAGSAAPRSSLRKPWSEFQRLHYLLWTDEFGCDESVKDQLPTLPAVQGPSVEKSNRGGDGDADDEAGNTKMTNVEIAGYLDAYLNTLLSIPAVVRSQVFSGFLYDNTRRESGTDERAGSDTAREDAGEAGAEAEMARNNDDAEGSCGADSPREPATAIDFLVQPFDYTSAYVARRAAHTERIDVLRGESVVWKFEILDHLDIDFSVVFRPHPVAVLLHADGSQGLLPPDEKVSVWTSDDQAGGEKQGERIPGGGDTNAAKAGGNAGGKRIAGKADGESMGATGKMQRGNSGGRWWSKVASAGLSQEQTDEGAQALAGNVAAAGDDDKGKESTVHLPTRYSTGGGDPVQGSFTCPADGTCTLKWDNSYSRLRGKRLLFVMESVTVQTMLAAIEAAGAADHKRRAVRSAGAQSILDSSPGQVKIAVTAVSVTDGVGSSGDGNAEALSDGCGGKGAEMRNEGTNASNFRFFRIRRIAATLLRDLGTLVDAQDAVESSMRHDSSILDRHDRGSIDGSGRGGVPPSPERAGADGVKHGDDACGGRYMSADATGVGKLVERFEQLEDEVASSSARRAQSEAQAKVLLATLQKSNTKTERLDRELEEAREQLAALQQRLEATEASRDESLASGAASSARLQSSEEALLRTKRERDLLQAERSVWQVARSGIQEELAKVVAELEQERHRHEDASRALSKSRESRALAEAELARLTRRLEEERGGIGGIRAALAAEREAARLAREEAEDARAAVAELDAAVAELGAQKRVLVAGLRARERALGDRCSDAETRAEESAMMRRAAEARVRELEEDAERREAAQADAEVRLQRLRAEKKVLLAEIRRGSVGSGANVARAAAAAATTSVSGIEDGLGTPGMLGRSGIDGIALDTGGGKGLRSNPGYEEGVEAEGASNTVSPIMGHGAGDVAIAANVMPMPPSASDTAQDKKAMLKQLSRQLVHLRERQHHLREDLAIDPGDLSAQRLQGDLDRAVRNLEVRIRKLLAGVGKDGSTGSPSSGASQIAQDSRGNGSRGVSEDVPRESGEAPQVSPSNEDVESFVV